MELILDTNAVSAVAEGDAAALSVLNKSTGMAIPVIVLGEYRFGVAQSRSHVEYEDWLKRLIRVSNVLEVDDDTATRYAEIRRELKRAGTPIPSNDIWIAALCRQHALPILSRDRHFDLVGGLERLAW